MALIRTLCVAIAIAVLSVVVDRILPGTERWLILALALAGAVGWLVLDHLWLEDCVGNRKKRRSSKGRRIAEPTAPTTSTGSIGLHNSGDRNVFERNVVRGFDRGIVDEGGEENTYRGNDLG